MPIQRFPYEGLGRCEAVVSDGLVYAVATDPQLDKGILAQTKNTLDELARILRKAGSGKVGLLQATVYLSDVKQNHEMDKAWIDWIGPEKHWGALKVIPKSSRSDLKTCTKIKWH